MRRLGLLLAWLLLAAGSAFAHKPSDSYLFIEARADSIEGRWDIALRDLDAAIGLDADGNGELTWGEVRSRHGEIAAYAASRLAIRAGETDCPIRATGHLVTEHTDGSYAVMRFQAACNGATRGLAVRYSLLFDIDAQHRGLLRVQGVGEPRSTVLSADAGTVRIDPGTGGALRQFGAFVADGVKHIAIGVDHILFLVVLLLPAVLVRELGKWKPTASLSRTLWNVFGIVTAFTVAHSITLTAAALQWVQLPSRLVESMIAVSVLLTALDNIWPFLPRRRWIVAFVFGLLHGFGFASVLLDLGLPAGSLALSLAGFNIGVELGQLALVLALVPLAHAVRARRGYSRFAVAGGSLVVAFIAVGWVIERAGTLEFMPF